MRVKLQMLSTIVCLAGILFGMACKKWFPTYWFDLYPLILVVYWIIEMVMSFIIERYEANMNKPTLEGDKWLKVYMVSKLVKVFITLALISVCLKFMDDHKVEFAMSAIAFYLLNLGVETYVITRKSKQS